MLPNRSQDAPESFSTGDQLQFSNQITDLTYHEALPLEHAAKRVDVFLKIPPRPDYYGCNPNGNGLLHLVRSSRGSSSARCLLPGPSFKNQAFVADERTPLLSSGHDARSDPMVPDKASLASYIAALNWKRCVSLPVTPAADLSPSVSSSGRQTPCNLCLPSHRRSTSAKVLRSLSVPIRNVVILRSTSFNMPKELDGTNTTDGQGSPDHLENGDEEIPEDEAVCRICLDELCGQSSLMLECSCKGALRLMHEECAMKWFGNKSNRKCDVCAQEILNLPVTLFRLQSSAHMNDTQRNIRLSSNSQLTRASQNAVVLLLISTMWYFFFLEQMVDDMRSQAFLIAAPVSLILGLFSSISSIFLAHRDYVWSYSAFQFVLVVMFLHLFYSVFRFSALYAILISMLLGFGVALVVNLFASMMLTRRAQAVRTSTNADIV